MKRFLRRFVQAVLLATLFVHSAFSLAKEEYYIPLPVNVNEVDALTLSRVMNGVGPKKAEAIVEYRKQHGRFHTIEELVAVKGIGPGTLNRNRSRITAD